MSTTPKPLIDHIEAIAADLRHFAEHINDQLTSPDELAARLRLINACKMVLAAADFNIDMDRDQLSIEDEEE